ncbi:unnamed protein product [Lampetra fluviatilis]
MDRNRKGGFETMRTTTTKTTKIIRKGSTGIVQHESSSTSSTSSTVKRKSSITTSTVSLVTFNTNVEPGDSLPEFTIKPPPLNVPEGKNVFMRAKIAGEPKPKVCWKRGAGNDVKEFGERFRDRYDAITGEHSLQIENATMDDTDTYKCVATNAYAEATCTFSLTVIENQEKTVDFKSMMKKRSKLPPPPPPKEVKVLTEKEIMELLMNTEKKDLERVCFELGITDFRGMLKKLKQMKKKHEEAIETVTLLKDMVDVVVKTGEKAIFEVHLEFKDPNHQRVRWFKNKELLMTAASAGKYEHKQFSSKHTLVIANADLSDQAAYSVEANEKTWTANLKVIDDPCRILSNLRPAHCKEKTIAMFEVALSKSQGDLKWTFNGMPIKRSDKMEIVSRDGGKIHQLIIKDARLSDKGTYGVCIGDQTSSAELIVDKEPIKFSSNLKTVRVKEKSGARLECEITTKDVTVRWLKNGQPIPQHLLDSGKVKVVSSGKHQELVIEDATLEDSGQYSIVVVQEGDTKEYVSAADVHVEERMATLQSGLSDQEVRTGQPSEFTVVLDDEKVEGTWRCDGKVIEQDDNVKIVKQGAVHKITIKNTQDKNMGRYTFTAKGVKTEGNLNVADPPEIDADLLERLMREPITVRAGQTALIDIAFTGKPVPKITWLKDGLEVEEDARTTLHRTSSQTSFCRANCQREDSGVVTLRLKSPCGSVSVDMQLNVIDVPKPPQGPVEFTERTGQCVTMKWKAPKDNGGRPVTSFVVERRQVGRSSWIKVGEVDSSETSFSYDKVEEGKQYQFRIRAVNTEGVSEALESAEVYAGEPYVPPGSPSAPVVSNVTKSSVTLSWQPPQSDGGSAILGYMVERRKKGSSLWVPVNTQLVQGTEVEAGKLAEDVEYEFQVTAVNAAGPGTPSSTSIPVLARDPIYPPGKLEDLWVTETTYSSVSLAWKPPLADSNSGSGGNSEAQGYVVEMRSEDSGEWVRCSKELVTGTRFTATGLREKGRYFFRVRAVNEAGVGEARELDKYVVAMPPPAAPRFHLTSRHQSYVFLKAGETLRLAVRFSGIPTPTVTWQKNTLALPDRANVSTEGGSTHMVISSADRSDSGIYSVNLANEAGSETMKIRVTVADVPRPPGEITLAEEISQTVTLTWEPSPDDLPEERVYYVVMKRDSSTMSWFILSDRVAHTRYTVTNLVPGRKYFFRVMARNDLGVSQPTDCKDAWQVPKQKNLFEVKLNQYQDKEREFAPEFVLPLKDHVAPPGNDVKMSCAVSGNPRPRVAWLCDGEPVSETSNVWCSDTYGVCSLHVALATAKDSGVYSAVASNHLGEASCSGKLAVTGEN